MRAHLAILFCLFWSQLFVGCRSGQVQESDLSAQAVVTVETAKDYLESRCFWILGIKHQLDCRADVLKFFQSLDIHYNSVLSDFTILHGQASHYLYEKYDSAQFDRLIDVWTAVQIEGQGNLWDETLKFTDGDQKQALLTIGLLQQDSIATHMYALSPAIVGIPSPERAERQRRSWKLSNLLEKTDPKSRATVEKDTSPMARLLPRVLGIDNYSHHHFYTTAAMSLLRREPNCHLQCWFMPFLLSFEYEVRVKSLLTFVSGNPNLVDWTKRTNTASLIDIYSAYAGAQFGASLSWKSFDSYETFRRKFTADPNGFLKKLATQALKRSQL